MTNKPKPAKTKSHRSIVGELGERIACAYLVKKGYKIVDKNYRKKFGEIDVVAQSKEGILVFCEVKTNIRTTVSEGALPGAFMPEDNATLDKLEKMRRMANFFAAKNPDLVFEDKGWRIDLIAVEVKKEIVSFVANKKDIRSMILGLRHYENCA